MSPQAVRVRTSSGWQDIAIQGAPGPPGRTPSCKASSSVSFAAADTYYRGIGLNFATVAFDDFGNSFSPAASWTCRQTGRYLIIASYSGLSATGAVGLSMDTSKKMHSATVTKGADGNVWGTECIWIGDYTVGNTLSLAGYHSGGGTGSLIFEAIRLDAPPISVPSPAPMRVTPAEFAALTPVDGLEVYLRADDTNGIVWHLRYNAGSSSAYKWEYLGGPPMWHRVEAQQQTASASYSDLATVGPQIIVPRIGEYRAQFGCRFDRVSADSWGEATLWVGGALPSNYADNAATAAVYAPANFFHTSRSVPVITFTTDTTTGRTVKMQYTCPGVNLSVMRRWLEVTPIRVS